jgi:hypothetical protein
MSMLCKDAEGAVCWSTTERVRALKRIVSRKAIAKALRETFDGLVQGAVQTVGGRQFQLSYAGGAGNDVTLTDVGLTDTTPITTVTAVEGNSTGNVVLATFIDGNPAAQASDFTATVNLGGAVVGTPTAAVQLVSTSSAGSLWQVVGSAAYAEKGTYTVTVSVNDTEGGRFTTAKTTVNVADAPLTDTTPVTTFSATSGTSTGNVVLATFTDANPSAGVSDFTETVNWGGPVAGTPTALIQLVSRSTTASTWQVVGSATFSSGGTFAVTVTIQDTDGSSVTTANTTASVAGNAAIILLDTSGKGALTDTGNGTIVVGGSRDIVVASKNAAAVVVSGNGKVMVSEIDLESTTGTQVSGNGHINAQVDRSAPASDAADPFAGLAVPAVPTTQLSAANISGNTVFTLQPGTYVGGIHISGNANVTLAAGIYYLKGGGFTVSGNATVTGNGVLLYNAPQSASDVINISGNAKVTLTAATSGVYQGVVIFQNRASSAPISVTGNGVLNLYGALYAADGTVNVSGNGQLAFHGPNGRLISWDLSVSGNGALTVGS